MFVDLDLIAKQFGTTDARLREIFEVRNVPAPGSDATAEQWAAYRGWQEDEKIRQMFETEITSRVEESMRWSLKNYKPFAAVDLAWDTCVVTKERLPLLLYAQGRIDIQACAKDLMALNCAPQFVKKAGDGSISIDAPRFIDVAFNLMRSFVTRRLAPQSNKYQNLWPFYKYEARGTDQVSKLRADVMSQEADIIADGYNYRDHEVQVYRDTLLYGHSIDFIRSKWEWEYQRRRKVLAKEFTAGGQIETELVVVKEGQAWTNPHPTRQIIDNSEPITSINSDSGPSYIGYWDVCRWSDVENNPAYWNRKSVSYGAGFWSLLSSYPGFSTNYLCNVTPPPSDSNNMAGRGIDLAQQNDRKGAVGYYSPEIKDASVVKAEYFRKLKPKDYRIGSYEYDVWVRFVAASDCKVIFAELLPSSPAAVCSFNESDQRQMNVSFGMGLLTYQDMMSNIITGTLLNVQAELFKIIGINTDVLEKTQIDAIRARLTGRDWSTDPLVVEFSLKALEELGLKAGSVMELKEARTGQAITAGFQAMMQLMALVEKLEAMSPAEQGQPAPREISATEVAEISSTTSTTSGFFSDAIDNYRAAKKRIIHESALACKKRKIQVPVVNRYTRKTIQDAGFTVVGDGEGASPAELIKDRNIIGEVSALDHEFIFTARDGAERPVNTQAANTLVQLMGFALQSPILTQKLTKSKIYEMFNEVFRMSGAGVDLKMELQEGEDDSLGEDQVAQLGQVVQQMQQALQQLAGQTQKNAEDVAKQDEVNNRQQEMLGGVNDLAKQVKKSAEDIHTIVTRMDQDKKALDTASRIYRDAPEETKRAIEEQIGIVITGTPTYLEEKLAEKPGTKTSVVGIV